ncbi:ATP-binding cassette domain-containing protein [Rhodococcus pyridinivorans]|uniref:ABC transporter ATP-binding protein/permease n=1 Tax=Rhodococcus pyridinivorans TaxID=103816 RepID=UPI001E4306D8|nr:ATP-binding cassette domain-containing protein [Rhodococcus pyridinivorans]UGQ56327.1 ATP-binding cassette domain-containing protein [Rhodococcus pyridinivorans]
MMIVRELWREARHFSGLLAGSVLLALLVFASYVGQAVAIAWALTATLQGTGPTVIIALASVTGLAVARVLLVVAQDSVSARLGGLVRRELRHRAIRSALTAERLHDAGTRDGSVRVALSDGIDGTDTYVSKYIPAVALILIACPCIVVALAVLNPWAGLWVAVAVVMALAGPLAWKTMMSRRGLEHWDSYEALSADLLESLRGMATLRALGDVPSTRQRMHERSEALRTATERVMRVSLAETGVTDFAIQAGTVAAVTTAIVHAATGQPPAFEVYLILLLSSEAFRPIRDLSRYWHAGFLGLTAVPGLHRLGAFDSPDNGSGTCVVEHGRSGRNIQCLQARGLRYRYPGSDTTVLESLDMTAHRGALTAIIGPSGAGKSTLFDVLLGFLTPESGTVELDGKSLRAGDIAVVSQRPVLFSGTIRDNLTVTGETTDADLVDACRAAGILDEILALPYGFDSRVAEAGLSLSGGQRQRLALARALLTRRPVLLVDEPTSALDPARAAEVMETLRHAAADRIVVMITHRPESLSGVNEQFRLEHGRLERKLV